tara:strand:+ start:89 stop:349 length:261 start_codon:yes stop_codon:yes gene_type:complete
MTGEQIREYIENELGCDPVHDVDALACAIEDVANEIEFDSFQIMRLLLENVEIPALHTHSYGFHTANGREIINGIQSKYYEYESTN